MPNNEGYTQISTVVNMRRAPRFGHSNNIALLASDKEEDKLNYLRGATAFAFFLLILFAAWGLILLVLKLLGKDRVGCAAGGNPIEIVELRRDEKRKRKITRIVRRSWRIQGTFFLTAIALSVATGFLLSQGLLRIDHALSEIQEVSQDVESLAYRGLSIAGSLKIAQGDLANANLTAVRNLASFCPNQHNSSLLRNLGLGSISDEVDLALQELDNFVTVNVDLTENTLQGVVSATGLLDKWIEWIFESDWHLRLYVMCLDVIVIFLLMGFFVARNGCIHYPLRCMLSFMFVPSFSVLIGIATFATCSLCAATILNADFCSGGPPPGSPEGTIETFLKQSSSTLTYQAFMYYIEDCTAEHPLEFVASYGPKLDAGMKALTGLLHELGEIGGVFNEECGADTDILVAESQILIETLDAFRSGLYSAFHLSGCSNIRPIFRRIFQGDILCQDTMDGLTWMFATLLTVSIFGMTLISLRAALYNPTMKAPKRDKAEEWEWEEYKAYMSQFYDNAPNWTYHPSQGKDDNKMARPIPDTKSFETSETSKSSLDDHSDFDDEDGCDSPSGRWDSGWSPNTSAAAIGGTGRLARASPRSYPQRMRPARAQTDAYEQTKMTRTEDKCNDVFDDELMPLTPPMPTVGGGKRRQELRSPPLSPPTLPEAPMKSMRTIQRSRLGHMENS